MVGKARARFRIVKKTPRSALITSFDLAPVDGQPVADYQPGQYLAIWLKPQEFEYQEIRQYSLTRKPDGKGYRIAVKREKRRPGIKLAAQRIAGRGYCASGCAGR